MKTVVGVDGCKLGWFYFRKDGASVSFGVAEDLCSLIDVLPSDVRIFIDIPIGLIDKGTTGRECDTLARKALRAPRASSVFSAPAYPVLAAKTYGEAKQISFQAIGKMLSQQAFAIAPKIREVNEFLAANLTLVERVREVHPEVCFWALNNKQAMKHAKKKLPGFEERMMVLRRFMPNADELVQGPLDAYKRKDVARDDILDALVALIVACAQEDQLQTFPSSPPKDTRGLPMEMVFSEDPGEVEFLVDLKLAAQIS